MSLLEPYSPQGWTAQYTVELIKNQEKADELFQKGEKLYKKLKKEREALGSLQDARVADDLAMQKIAEAEATYEKAKAAAAKLVEEATIEADQINAFAKKKLEEAKSALEGVDIEKEEFGRLKEKHFEDARERDRSLNKREREIETRERDCHGTERRVSKIFNHLDEINKLR